METAQRRAWPRVQQLLASGEYPIFTKIALAARQPHVNRDDQFQYGVERVLNCMAAAVESDAYGLP